MRIPHAFRLRAARRRLVWLASARARPNEGVGVIFIIFAAFARARLAARATGQRAVIRLRARAVRWPRQAIVADRVHTRDRLLPRASLALQSRRRDQRLLDRNRPVPGRDVVEVRHIHLQVLLDQLVAERDPQRLQLRPKLIVRTDSIWPDEEDEVRDDRRPVRRLRIPHTKKLLGDGQDDRARPGVDDRGEIQHRENRTFRPQGDHSFGAFEHDRSSPASVRSLVGKDRVRPLVLLGLGHRRLQRITLPGKHITVVGQHVDLLIDLLDALP